jgi:hypothetical protein
VRIAAVHAVLERRPRFERLAVEQLAQRPVLEQRFAELLGDAGKGGRLRDRTA